MVSELGQDPERGQAGALGPEPLQAAGPDAEASLVGPGGAGRGGQGGAQESPG